MSLEVEDLKKYRNHSKSEVNKVDGSTNQYKALEIEYEKIHKKYLDSVAHEENT